MPWFDDIELLRGFILLWFGVVGACIGSFLNVVVYRLPSGRNLVHPGSRCPSCATAIAPWDNIPILSWFILRGRCRHCHLPIAARYPQVEFGVAVLFVLLSAVWLPPHRLFDHGDATTAGSWLALFACLTLMSTWISATLIESDGQFVPFRLVIPSSLVVGVHVVISLCGFGSIYAKGVADTGGRAFLFSLLGAATAGLVASRIVRPSVLVSGSTWTVLLVATGSLFGLNGFVAIWLIAASVPWGSVGCRWVIGRIVGGSGRRDATMAACREPGLLGSLYRMTGGMAAWTLATLGWSVVGGLASTGGGKPAYWMRVASLPSTIDWFWVLVVGTSAVLISLLTPWVGPGQSRNRSFPGASSEKASSG